MDKAVLRIIDANANRASEAARVLEDAARLGLGDAAVALRCKSLRHALRNAVGGIDSAELHASRDTPGDVGTSMTGEMEGERGSLAEVCIAAGKRLGEALRVLEETLKLLPGSEICAGRVKALRYEGYELGKHVTLALARPRRQWRLCVILSEVLCNLSWDEVARAAIRGGADCLQLREKAMPGRQLLARAEALMGIASENTGPSASRVDIIINDRPDIASMVGAAGVHLGQDDVTVEAARRVLGPRQIVGVSTACIADARRALEDGADYVGLGPMYPSTTKRKAGLAGVEYLRDFRAWDRTRVEGVGGAALPYLAISGIDAMRAGQLASEGCAGVAVSSVVCSSTEPEKVCAAIVRAMGGACGAGGSAGGDKSQG